MGKTDEWVQLVVVRHGSDNAFLFRAPAFSVNVGDRVLVETKYGDRLGTAIFVNSYDLGNEKGLTEAKGIASAFGANWPLKKVLAVQYERKLDWGEENG